MAIVKVVKNSYTVESLYQWDLNQVLQIYGLSLASVPEIHFTNSAMDRAIVRQASMDSAGVISVDVPNSMLQKPYTIKAYVCIYEGDTFTSLYKIEIPVKARNKPSDYTLTDDPEVYSFNALENQVVNVLAKYAEVDKKHTDAINKLNTATNELGEAKKTYADAATLLEESIDAAVEEITSEVDTYGRSDILSDETRTLYGLDASVVPDEVLALIKSLVDSKSRVEFVSYVGTGLVGIDNPCSLTFSFKPKVVMLIGYFDSDMGFHTVNTHNDTGGYNALMFIDKMSTEYVKNQGFGYSYASHDYGKVSEDGKTINWYYSDTSGKPEYQYNKTNVEYCAMAIG